MFIDLLLTPFVLVAAVCFLFGTVLALGTGYHLMVRLCRHFMGRLPDCLCGGLIEDAVWHISCTTDLSHGLIQYIEKRVYIGAVIGWLVFGPQMVLFVAYGAVFTLVAGLVKAIGGRKVYGVCEYAE